MHGVGIGVHDGSWVSTGCHQVAEQQNGTKLFNSACDLAGQCLWGGRKKQPTCQCMVSYRWVAKAARGKMTVSALPHTKESQTNGWVILVPPPLAFHSSFSPFPAVVTCIYLSCSLLRNSLTSWEMCFLAEGKMWRSIPLPYLPVKYEATARRWIALLSLAEDWKLRGGSLVLSEG